MLRNIFAVVALAVVALSCDGSIVDPPPPPKDTTPPVVTSVSPTRDAKDVAVTSEVKVTFSESVDPATVNLTTFKVMNGPAAVPGTTSSGSPTATFIPTETLEYSTTYTAVVSGVKDMVGNQMLGEHRWSFTTAADPNAWTVVGDYSATKVAANENGAYVAGKSTVSGNHSSFTAAFTVDGGLVWKEETVTEGHCSMPRGIAVANGYVYTVRAEDPFPCIGNADIYVDARDAETGELLWSALVAGGWSLDMTIYHQSLYLVGNFGLVEVDVAADGRVVRTLTRESFGGSGTGYGSVAVDENTVYLGGKTLQDLGSGTETGQYGDLFLAAFDKELSVPPRWVRQWTNSLDLYKGGIALAPGANTVYLSGHSGVLVGEQRNNVFLAYTRQGEFRWSWVGTEGDDISSVVSDGANVYSGGPIKVHSDGAVAWVGSPTVRSYGVSVENSTVFVTDGTNRLLRYDAATGVMKH